MHTAQEVQTQLMIARGMLWSLLVLLVAAVAGMWWERRKTGRHRR